MVEKNYGNGTLVKSKSMVMLSWNHGMVSMSTARTASYKEYRRVKTEYIDSVQGQVVYVDCLIRTIAMSSAFTPVSFNDSIAAYQETITNYVSAGCLSVRYFRSMLYPHYAHGPC